ncbi:MAG TPA: hypothetical protein VHQ47_02905 [Phycisphaerae bacterium]|nr:hypothetical protein [Phycisphaerae bacterium]
MAIPRLIGYDDEGLLVEMTIVEPMSDSPELLSFALSFTASNNPRNVPPSRASNFQQTRYNKDRRQVWKDEPMTLATLDPPEAKKPPDRAPVSERLALPLRRVAGRARSFALLRSLLQLFVLLGSIILLLALSLGSFRQVPVPIAFLLALAAWALILIGIARITRRIARRRRDLAAAAWLADQANPENQERISSAVEISQEHDPRFRGSPELVAVLLRQAEKAADKLVLADVISARQVARWFAFAFPVALAWVILFAALGPRLELGLRRGLMPWTAANALPAALLTVTPGNATLAEGDSLTIDLTVKPSADGFSPSDTPVDRATLIKIPADPNAPTQSIEMDRTGSQSFRTAFDNLQEADGGFSYKIQSAGAAAGPFTVRIQPRPAVTNLRLDYHYPAYTRLADRTDQSRDGTIDALVGTKVTLSLESSLPLSAASPPELDLSDATGDHPIPLTKSADKNPRYATTLDIQNNGQYRIHLTANNGLQNHDDQPRTITARPDAPPTISITDPPNAATLKVRPDDTVTIRFAASDDFGLSKLEGLLLVDEGLPSPVPLPLNPGEQKHDGSWTLHLADILRTPLAAGLTPKRVFYQIRATDNRDPNPQSATSAKGVLEIDRTVAPLAQRQDQQAVKNLTDAIEQAKAALQQAKQDEAALHGQKPLTPEQKQTAADAQQKLAQAHDTLARAAQAATGDRAAAQAKNIADTAEGPVKNAQDQAAKAALAADQPADRTASAAAAEKQIADAQSRLNAAEKALGAEAKQDPLAHSLEDLAQRQQQLAQQMAANPNDPKLQAQQKDLQKQLEQVIKDHPELQQPAAAAHQQQMDALANQVHQLENKQQPLADSVHTASQSRQTQQSISDLAKDQSALNREIGQFNQQQSSALKSADAQTPDDRALSPIVKDLADNKLSDAAKAQQSAAQQLNSAAQKLSDSHNAQSPADRAAQSAANAQSAARQLSKDIDRAQASHNPPTRPSDPANETARALADQIRQAAQELQQSFPAARRATGDAVKAADAAKADANQGKAKEAQQQLSNAANRLADAAKAAGGNPSSNADNAGAAKQAQQLAQKQQDLADRAAQLAQSLDAAAHPQQSAEQQRSLASQMDQAAQQAASLQKDLQGAAPDMANKAAAAAQDLRAAAQEQRASADATAASDPATADSRQARSADKLGDAEQALTGQRSARSAHPPQQTARSSPQPSQQPRQSPQPPTQSTPAQQSSPQSPQQTAQSNSPSAHSGQPSQQPGQQPSQQVAGSSPESSQESGQPSAQSAKSSAQSGQPSAQSGQPSAQADQGTPQSAQSSGQPGQPSGQPSAQSPGAQSGNQASAQSGNPTAQPSPQSAQQLAQAVQAARTAQAQAANGDPASAQRAAQALAQASRSLSPPSPAGQSQANATPSPGSATHGAQGQPGAAGQANPTGTPTPNSGNGSGINLATAPPAGAGESPNAQPPKEVQELGIAPSDWAKLPSSMQGQLLHAAQQSGPPAYRDMIKNYFTRIARMQADNETPE